MYSGRAWTKPDPCDPSTFTGAMTPASAAVPAATVPAATTVPACGSAYVPGADYEAGDVVAVVVDNVPTNYVCQADPLSNFCKQEAFAPGGCTQAERGRNRT